MLPDIFNIALADIGDNFMFIILQNVFLKTREHRNFLNSRHPKHIYSNINTNVKKCKFTSYREYSQGDIKYVMTYNACHSMQFYLQRLVHYNTSSKPFTFTNDLSSGTTAIHL